MRMVALLLDTSPKMVALGNLGIAHVKNEENFSGAILIWTEKH